MAWPLSGAAQAALRGSHSVTYRVTAYTGKGTIDVPISGGAVSADSKSQIRRTATIDVSDITLWDLLAPFGTEVFIEYGIVTPDGTEWVPLIYGVAGGSTDTRPRDGAKGFTVTISDRSVLVTQARYELPSQTVGGALATAEITRLITEVLPTVTVTDLTGSLMVLPQLSISKDRWSEGVEKIADALAAECYADRLGNFVIAPTPTDADPEVWTVDEGERGVLVTANRALTRESVYNAVIVVGTRTDGAPPILARVYDDDPDSQTYYGGPFGKKPLFYSSAAIVTTAQGLATGTALLARSRGTQAAIALTNITNPGLDPGDVVLSRFDGLTYRHVIDSVSVPLDPTAIQGIGTRSTNLPNGSS